MIRVEFDDGTYKDFEGTSLYTYNGDHNQYLILYPNTNRIVTVDGYNVLCIGAVERDEKGVPRYC